MNRWHQFVLSKWFDVDFIHTLSDDKAVVWLFISTHYDFESLIFFCAQVSFRLTGVTKSLWYLFLMLAPVTTANRSSRLYNRGRFRYFSFPLILRTKHNYWILACSVQWIDSIPHQFGSQRLVGKRHRSWKWPTHSSIQLYRASLCQFSVLRDLCPLNKMAKHSWGWKRVKRREYDIGTQPRTLKEQTEPTERGHRSWHE
jgi:hypothetical protein